MKDGPGLAVACPPSPWDEALCLDPVEAEEDACLVGVQEEAEEQG